MLAEYPVGLFHSYLHVRWIYKGRPLVGIAVPAWMQPKCGCMRWLHVSRVGTATLQKFKEASIYPSIETIDVVSLNHLQLLRRSRLEPRIHCCPILLDTRCKHRVPLNDIRRES